LLLINVSPGTLLVGFFLFLTTNFRDIQIYTRYLFLKKN